MCVPVEGVCQPAWGVMDMTTVWTAQMRSVQFDFINANDKCAFFKVVSLQNVFFFFFLWQGGRWLKRRTFNATLKWHFKDMSCSFLADWLCEGVQGGWVPLSEPRSLHPSALALRWRVWLHGPQWRGKLQPRCGWWFMMQRKMGRFTVQCVSEHLFGRSDALLCTE